MTYLINQTSFCTEHLIFRHLLFHSKWNIKTKISHQQINDNTRCMNILDSVCGKLTLSVKNRLYLSMPYSGHVCESDEKRRQTCVSIGVHAFHRTNNLSGYFR